MLTRGQRLVCTIDNLGYKGEGVFRSGGQVGFVPYALPGETVSVEIEKAYKSHAFANLLEVITPSPQRMDASCPLFTRCGGCAVQHLPYVGQLAMKRQHVVDSLGKIARLDADVLPAVGMDAPWHYRNKTTWQTGMADGQPFLGFFAARSHQAIPVPSCLIAAPQANAAAALIRGWMAENGITPFDPISGLGLLRQVITRVNQLGELMVILMIAGEQLPHLENLINRFRQDLPILGSLCVSSDSLTEDDEDGLQLEVIDGKPSLAEWMGGIGFHLSPFSFMQVNHQQCGRMYDYVLKRAISSPQDRVFDLYSGIGVLSLAAAKQCREVTGIELSSYAVEDARKNAAQNNITNASFIQGFAEKALPALVDSGQRAEAIILDPPRKGAHQRVLDAMIKAAPERIVYISCHPASQARDAAILAGGGYMITACQPFDMFCQTAEIENVITFVKKGQA